MVICFSLASFFISVIYDWFYIMFPFFSDSLYQAFVTTSKYLFQFNHRPILLGSR